jgi:hypothetical protein
MYSIPNDLKQEDALLQLLLRFTSEYPIGKVQENQPLLKLNRTHQLLANGGDVNLLGDNTHTLKKMEKL